MIYIIIIMIYILVTATVNNYFHKRIHYKKCTDIRKEQYIKSIKKLLEVTKSLKNKKVILIENGGDNDTFLNDFKPECDTFYTNNTFDRVIKTSNKGRREMRDINQCIKKYNIKDDDFIVKITGRYFLDDNSEFINSLNNLKNIDCIIKYGKFIKTNGAYASFGETNNIEGSFTGLIGMRGKYVKTINYKDDGSDDRIWVEKKWANATKNINKNKIVIPKTLGINVCPGSNTYFFM